MGFLDDAKAKAEELARQARPKIDQAREKAGPLAQQAREKAEELAQQAKPHIEQAREKAQPYVTQAREKAEQAAQSMRDRNKPPPSVLHTPGFAHYGLAWSPFHNNRLALASAANYGLVGNGRLHIVSLGPGPGMPGLGVDHL